MSNRKMRSLRMAWWMSFGWILVKGTAVAAAPVLGFSTYLGSYMDRGRAIAVDGTGSAYVAGQINSHAFVTKINAAGTQIVYSTFLGDERSGEARAIAVDSEGSAYVAGWTPSGSFVTKLDASGRIAYSTLLGGSNGARVSGIAVDSAKSAYVTGATESLDFDGVTPGSFQPQFAGLSDAFVTKIKPDGKLDYGTFLGGDGSDTATGIAVDSAHSVYVTGNSGSRRFPGTPQGTDSTGVFVTKLNAVGGGIDYTTILSGDAESNPAGVAVDSAGNAYLTGGTRSTTRFSGVTLGSMQPNSGGGWDAYVTKLNAQGRIEYSTFLGAIGNDFGRGIAVDATGSVTILGDTEPLRNVLDPFPGVTGTSIQSRRRGLSDAFVAQLDPAGAMAYSTFLGGSAEEEGGGIAVDGVGDVYVTGLTLSSDFPGIGPRSIQPTASQGGVFVAKIQTRLQRFWMTVASAGTVDESAAGFYAATDAALGYLPGSAVAGQPIVARYRVVNTTPTDVAPWDTLELGYFDNAPGSSVTARLIRVEPCTGALTPLCTVASVDAAGPTCRACTFSTPLDFPHYLYYVEVTLLRQTPDLFPQALTLRLY